MDRIIRPKEAAERMGVCIATLYNYMKRPDFPDKVSLSPGAVGFFESDLKEWMLNRSASHSKTPKGGSK